MLWQLPHHVFGHSDSLVFNVGMKPPSAEDIVLFERSYQSVIDRSRPMLMIQIVRETGSERISQETRTRLLSTLAKLDLSMRGQAVVIETTASRG